VHSVSSAVLEVSRFDSLDDLSDLARCLGFVVLRKSFSEFSLHWSGFLGLSSLSGPVLVWLSALVVRLVELVNHVVELHGPSFIRWALAVPFSESVVDVLLESIALVFEAVWSIGLRLKLGRSGGKKSKSEFHLF